MTSLDIDIQTPKKDLEEFNKLTQRILEYIPNVITQRYEKRGYILASSDIAGRSVLIRPINMNLFIFDKKEFDKAFGNFENILSKIKDKNYLLKASEIGIIDKCTYTIQQSIGIGLDLLVDSNAAKKHIGNRFEELIRAVLNKIEIKNKKIILKIPYSENEVYKCETDIVFSSESSVRSNDENIDENEVVVSIKTTSKDRMAKIFIDKLLMEKFVGHKIKMIGIFLNDVQRKKTDSMSFTFVSNLFIVYNKFLTTLDGIYFIDIPPHLKNPPFNKYINTFSNFLTKDLKDFLNHES